MSKYNTLTKLFFTGLTAILLTACGGGSSSYNSNNNEDNYYTANGEAITLGASYSTCQYGSATQEGKIIDSNTNKGLKHVRVSISGCSVETDEKGYYKLSNIKSFDRAPITFNKEGYYKNSKIISLSEGTSNYIEYELDPYKSWSKWSFKTTDGIKKGNVIIKDTAIYTNKLTGKQYDGNVTGYWIHKSTNTLKNKTSFPGSYQGIDSNGIIVSFISYAFAVVEFVDDENNQLNTSESITIELKDIYGTKDQTIPLWYYDYDKGIWIEKGVGQRDENGKYICEISHPGTWSLNKPIETEMGMYKGRIVDSEDNPVSHVRLKAIGNKWISEDLTTDENGEFKIYVVPNEKFTLSAYDYKEKFGATFPGKLAGIAAGDVVEE